MQPFRPSRKTSAPSSLKPVSECPPIAALLERARALETLDQRLRQPLPVALRQQCRLATVREGRLIFLASSSTWAAKLRLYQTAIMAEARVALGNEVEKFAVKVAPLPPVPPGPTGRKPLSQAAAAHLKTAASSLPDPDLRAMYLRLASLAE